MAESLVEGENEVICSYVDKKKERTWHPAPGRGCCRDVW